MTSWLVRWLALLIAVVGLVMFFWPDARFSQRSAVAYPEGEPCIEVRNYVFIGQPYAWLESVSEYRLFASGRTRQTVVEAGPDGTSPAWLQLAISLVLLRYWWRSGRVRPDSAPDEFDEDESPDAGLREPR